MTVLRATEVLIRSLEGVWDEEAVDELAHARQAAACAIADGADDELVLASALHDLGHSPLLGIAAPTRHDAVAREWLTPRYGTRVGWLAGAHVAAKRHLVATESGYAAGLTDTSADSLLAQGGPAVDAAMIGHPWWPDALRLRRYDDAAKVPGAEGATIEHVLEVAERILKRRESRGRTS